MLANNTNNSDKRLYQKMLQADTSHSSFRESAKQALAATKHYDGSLRIHTPFQDEQSKKVQNLKHQLTKLSSTSNYKRCQSGLNDSSTNSVTAATSYAAHQPHGSGITGSGAFQYRPNSNISNFLNDGAAYHTTTGGMGGKYHNYGTELTRFSQNSYSKDLSPLRVSNLNERSSANNNVANNQNINNNFRATSGGANPTRQQYEQKHVMTQSAAQHARRHSGLQSGYSPVYQSNAVTRNPKFEMEHQNIKRNSVANRRENSTGSLYRSGSRRGHSQRSLRTNHSSPERLVNIVCPPSKGSKNKRQARISESRSKTTTRPQSDMMRHQIYNSFGVNSEQQSRRKNISKQMKAFADSQGFLYNSFQSKQQRDNKSQQRHCMANLMKNRMMVSTPLKSRQSATSLSQTRSKSKQKSRSCSRLGQNARLSRQDSASGLSAKRSSKKLQQKAFMSKWIKSGSQNRLSRKRSASNKSLRSKQSGRSTSRSHNSNTKGAPSDVMKRDQRRVTKYLIHQGRDSSLKKSMDFDSIVTEKQESWPQSTKAHTKAASGQVTGKFRSLNEQMISQMMTNQQNHQQHQHTKKAQQVAFADSSLRTEDDYCETLTASSEESPLRPAKRVQRAAQLTTKAYLDEVTQRVDKVNNQHGEQSIREFGPRKLKAAYQGINERQGARLQCLKQQMKESLVETHLLQSKLQSSAGDDHHNLNGTMKHRGHQVSQFNSLVLEFSNNLENMATEMIEATEKKRRNMRMHEKLNEMEMTRRARSRSGSKSCPISARKRKSPRSGSKRKSRKSTPKSARSKSSGKKLKKSKGRKRSKSTGKKLKKRSKSKSLKRSRSLSKSARSARSGLSAGGRSATSGASSRGRSRSRKKIKSVKRNIFKQTNGFRDVSNGSFGPLMRKPSRSKSKKSRGVVSISKSRSKSGVRKRSLSTRAFSRARELAKKCESLVKTRFNVVNKNNTQVPKSRKRSISLNKKKGQKPSKSRSKSKGKKMVKKSTKSGKVSKSRSKSARKRSARMGSKSPAFFDKSVTPKIEPQLTPCMTPLHNILRNSMGDPEFTDMRSRMNTRFGSTTQQQRNKKVKICSRRLQDISRMSSSDSDSSLDSERSMSHERYMRRQQAHLSPWQRACIRKQMPKKYR